MPPGPSTSDVEPSWKKISLSLERPYKDDHGDSLPILLDITPEGERVYEPSVLQPVHHNHESNAIIAKGHPLPG
jgi:hypothetical protein